MPTACSAFGCTYRKRKGDNIGFFYFPKKDEHLRLLWTIAIRRANWEPSPTSRICGKHFQTGRPSHDKDHPDYVPNVFVFNQGKNSTPRWKKYANLKASQRVAELRNATNDVTSLKGLKSKREGNDMHSLPQKAKKKIVRWPAKRSQTSCHFSQNMKENDNIETREAVTVSNNDGRYLKQIEIRPALPQKRVWILNITPAKKNPETSAEKPKEVSSSFASVSGNSLIPTADYSVFPYKDAEPDHIGSASDDSTLTANSPIPDTEDVVPLNNDLSVAANKDPVVLKVNPTVVGSEKAAYLNADTTEKVTNDSMSVPTINQTSEENAEYDYSYFACSPFDTKEDLAIKLETMLAVNISLQAKIRFYQNKCKKYEQEITDLTKIVENFKLNSSVL